MSTKDLERFCPICSEVVPVHCMRSCITKCGHIFHYNCLSRWCIDYNITCPLCREELYLENSGDILMHFKGCALCNELGISYIKDSQNHMQYLLWVNTRQAQDRNLLRSMDRAKIWKNLEKSTR